MNKIKKHSVEIAAFASAIVLVLQQALSSGQTSWKSVGYAVFLALLGVVSKQWGGKGFTVFGILGTLAGVFTNNYQTGSFTWNEFILSAAVALLLAVVGHLQPDPKPAETNS